MAATTTTSYTIQDVASGLFVTAPQLVNKPAQFDDENGQQDQKWTIASLAGVTTITSDSLGGDFAWVGQPTLINAIVTLNLSPRKWIITLSGTNQGTIQTADGTNLFWAVGPLNNDVTLVGPSAASQLIFTSV